MTSSGPLTGRILGYGLDLILAVMACVILPSGLRMATSAILVRATVAYLGVPFLAAADVMRAGHFTFFSSLASEPIATYLDALEHKNEKWFQGLYAKLFLFPELTWKPEQAPWKRTEVLIGPILALPKP